MTTTRDEDAAKQREEREQSIEDRERQINEREDRVDEMQRKAQRDLNDLAKRRKELAESESSVEERARSVIQLEIEAGAGFAAKNRDALAELTKTHATLRADVDRLHAELDAARLKQIESLEKSIAEERRARTAALDAELAEQRARFVKERSEALDDIEKKRAELQEKEIELRRGLRELRWQEEELAVGRAGIERSVEVRAGDAVASLQRQLDAKRENDQRKTDLVIALESQLASSRDLLARFGDDPAEIERRIDQQVVRIGDLEKELLRRPSASDKELLVTLQEQAGVSASERDRLVR
ncbi:MAG: hypothetical protein KC492_15925, partial [Myxococcales bacterium]|nr:hypothetical protein [Myxococcales bacterium]